MLPGSFEVPAGQSTSLSLAVGEQFIGVPVAFSSALVAGFWQLTAAGRTELGVRTPASAQSPEVPVRLARAGTHLFALDTHPSFVQLPADKFNDYLRQEGLHRVLRARHEAGTSETPGRERYRRNVKSLIQAGGSSDGTFARRTHQRLEIVPAADPHRMTVPSPLVLQVFFDGRPLSQALVRVWQRHAGVLTKLEAITDGRGRAIVTLPRAGAWMASVVHMVPATGARGIDWESYWGNLTFAVPPRLQPK
jgi:hypothetical protein